MEAVTIIYINAKGESVKGDIPWDAPLIPNTVIVSI